MQRLVEFTAESFIKQEARVTHISAHEVPVMAGKTSDYVKLIVTCEARERPKES